VVERDGWMSDLIEGGRNIDRRQDAPPVYWIHGALYIWRSGFVRTEELSWRHTEKLLIYETPRFRSMSIDTDDEFKRAELLVDNGLISFPWLKQTQP
jgi:CMP-N-acetylneuraminic acid synthetase